MFTEKYIFIIFFHFSNLYDFVRKNENDNENENLLFNDFFL